MNTVVLNANVLQTNVHQTNVQPTEVSSTGVPSTKCTWAILCTPAVGKSYPEYVEGTSVTQERDGIQIWDGSDLVREYVPGSWSNFCEWVAIPELYPLDVIRIGDSAPSNSSTAVQSLPIQRAY